MSVEELKELLERGETLHVAESEYKFYSGSSIDGSTENIVMTKDSNAKTNLSPEENESLELIETIEPIFSRKIEEKHRTRPKSVRGKVIFVNDEPFKVWERHRGMVGEDKNKYDKFHQSYQITELEELIDLF